MAEFLVFDKTRMVRVAVIDNYDGGEFVHIPVETECTNAASKHIMNEYVVVRHVHDGTMYLLAVRDNIVPLNPELYIESIGIKPYP